MHLLQQQTIINPFSLYERPSGNLAVRIFFFRNFVSYQSSILQGKHVDRLITVCYLPLNLMVLTLLIPLHNSGHSVTRVLSGFIVFALSMLIVPIVRLSNSFDASALNTCARSILLI